MEVFIEVTAERSPQIKGYKQIVPIHFCGVGSKRKANESSRGSTRTPEEIEHLKGALEKTTACGLVLAKRMKPEDAVELKSILIMS